MSGFHSLNAVMFVPLAGAILIAVPSRPRTDACVAVRDNAGKRQRAEALR